MTQPRTLLMIRHGEEPSNGDLGIDEQGNANPDSGSTKRMGAGGRARHAFRAEQHDLELHAPLAGCPCHPQICRAGAPPLPHTGAPVAAVWGVTILSEHAVDADPTKIVSSLFVMETVVVIVCWQTRSPGQHSWRRGNRTVPVASKNVPTSGQTTGWM